MSDMPPAPPPPPGSYSAGQPATRPGELLDRFLARLIDAVILLIVNTIVVGVIVVGVILGGAATGVTTGTTYVATAVGAILTTIIYLGYFAFFESSQGRTVGKIAMKLRVVGPTGANPTLEQAIRRNIWMGFSLLAIIPVVGALIGDLAALAAVIMIAVGINGDTVARQAWHDHFAGETRVLKQA